MGQERIDTLRSYELDWLRVGAVLMLIVYHTSMMFSIGWFHIKNSETHYFFNIVCRFIEIWHMPLFFVVSGASAWFALEFRTGRQFRLERIRRLVIPLLFGILLIIPPLSYFENLQKTTFNGSFIEFYPNFFNGIYPKGNLSWSHLWFIYYLFNFSLVCSLLFPSLKTSTHRNRISFFAKRFSRGHSVFGLAVPILIIEIGLRWRFSGFQTFFTDWANVFNYLFIFIFGFLLYSDKSLTDAISANKKQAVLLAIPCSICFLFVNHFSNSVFVGYDPKPTGSYLITHPEMIFYYIALMTFKAIAEWSWLIAILGYAREFLSNKKKGIEYLSKIAFPFYVFHHTVVIVIGFYVAQLSLNLWLKYFLVSLSSIPLIYVCCALAKSNKVSRFMFGIK